MNETTKRVMRSRLMKSAIIDGIQRAKDCNLDTAYEIAGMVEHYISQIFVSSIPHFEKSYLNSAELMLKGAIDQFNVKLM